MVKFIELYTPKNQFNCLLISDVNSFQKGVHIISWYGQHSLTHLYVKLWSTLWKTKPEMVGELSTFGSSLCLLGFLCSEDKFLSCYTKMFKFTAFKLQLLNYGSGNHLKLRMYKYYIYSNLEESQHFFS